MKDDILESVSQGSDGAQTSENCRIAEISNELQRLCAVYEAQSPIGPADANRFEVEQRAAEALAKAQGFWIPLTNVFDNQVVIDAFLLPLKNSSVTVKIRR